MIKLLLTFFCCLTIAAQAQTAEVYVTSKNSDDRLAKKESLKFTEEIQPDEHTPTIILDKNKTFQTFYGIGGALTDASAETYYKMSKAKQQEIITALFDKEKGNGFVFNRGSYQ